MRSTLNDRSHNRGMLVSRHCPCPGQGRGYRSHPWIQTFRGVSDIILIHGNLITMDDGFMIFSSCPLSVGWGRSVPSEVGLSIQGVWFIISLPALEWKTGRLQMPNSLESRITFPMGQCKAFLRDQFGLEGSEFEKNGCITVDGFLPKVEKSNS